MVDLPFPLSARRLSPAAAVAALALALSPAALAQGAGGALPAPGSVFRDCAECPEMVVVPRGRFTMGSPAGERARMDSEGPQRRVAIATPFALGRYEVTRAEFAVFARETGHNPQRCVVWDIAKKDFVMGATASWADPGFPQTDRHPATCVSWDDAKAYVAWLAKKTGRSYRLPSEAEWEYAARAGTATRFFWGDDGDAGCRYANGADESSQPILGPTWIVMKCDDGHRFTAPAGSFAANRFGLHDMSGNVSEWVEDCWIANYGGAPADGRARLTGDCGRRVVRGGSWSLNPGGLRSAARWGLNTGNRINMMGFRVARGE